MVKSKPATLKGNAYNIRIYCCPDNVEQLSVACRHLRYIRMHVSMLVSVELHARCGYTTEQVYFLKSQQLPVALVQNASCAKNYVRDRLMKSIFDSSLRQFVQLERVVDCGRYSMCSCNSSQMHEDLVGNSESDRTSLPSSSRRCTFIECRFVSFICKIDFHFDVQFYRMNLFSDIC